MAGSNEGEGDGPLEHRLLWAVDREPWIGDEWVVMQHTHPQQQQQQQQQPRRLPPIAAAAAAQQPALLPATVTKRSKKRNRRIAEETAATAAAASPRMLPRKVPPLAPKEEVVVAPVAPPQMRPTEQQHCAPQAERLPQQPPPLQPLPAVAHVAAAPVERFPAEATEALIRESRAPRFVDFTVSAQLAKEHLARWRDSLWLAPGDLGTVLSQVQPAAFFVPYHAYSGVALLQQGQTAAGSKRHREFVDMLAHLPCCNDIPGNEPDSSISRAAITELEPWSIKTAQTPAVAAASRAELALLAGGLSAVRIVDALTPLEVWSSIVEADLRKMIAGIDGPVQSFEDVTFRTVYMPMYAFWYTHSGHSYVFLVNGQTGETWGQRPIGLGGVTRVLAKLFTGAAVSSPRSVGLASGNELNVRDKTSVYAPEHHFLVLPPSDQFLMATAVGWAELANNSGSAIKLRAQWRSAAKYGPAVVLGSQERIAFGFRGGWVIEVLSGDASAIGVLQCETSGGSDKGNSLGMIEQDDH